ncbi:hypothetical protein M0804_009970 [Polistes exclamans]|nr:hypothetical protein M0804_009970 [Polistes exclamans]
MLSRVLKYRTTTNAGTANVTTATRTTTIIIAVNGIKGFDSRTLKVIKVFSVRHRLHAPIIFETTSGNEEPLKESWRTGEKRTFEVRASWKLSKANADSGLQDYRINIRKYTSKFQELFASLAFVFEDGERDDYKSERS